MKHSLPTLFALVAAVAAQPLSAQEESWEPTRINKVIELWENDQPAYYHQIVEYDYETGQELAQTEADYISINMEHGYIDVAALRDFMRGLVDGGPTPSGHRTPAVVAVLPAWGWSEAAMEANAYLAQQIMGAGVHGLLLTHVVDPGAVHTLIEAIRFPDAPIAPGLGEGRQGQGSQGFPAEIWGVEDDQYQALADPYPLNPNGEVIIGLKIEDRFGQEVARELLNIPGVAFVEHGPGDTRLFLAGVYGDEVPEEAEEEAHMRVWDAAVEAGVQFLQTCEDITVLDQGTGVCTNLGSAEEGRIARDRQMPW